MRKKHFDIEQYEQEILADFEKGELVSVDNAEQEIQLARQAARNFAKRNHRINIRVSGADLNMVRRIAAQEGLPYQTLLASVIHKFAAGRLTDRGVVSKRHE
jgi:predicted DNA binding CopG/RHH family protein